MNAAVSLVGTDDADARGLKLFQQIVRDPCLDVHKHVVLVIEFKARPQVLDADRGRESLQHSGSVENAGADLGLCASTLLLVQLQCADLLKSRGADSDRFPRCIGSRDGHPLGLELVRVQIGGAAPLRNLSR